MKLYIGNAGRQHHDFTYWVPGAKAPRVQRIEIGKQTAISGDLDQAAVDSIVAQHRPYGLISVPEIDGAKALSTLCYAVDKPVPSAALQRLMERNAGIMRVRGKEIRREAAVASNDGLESGIAESGRPERLRVLDMSVVEENHDDRDEAPPVAEGFRITRAAPDRPNPIQRRKRAA